MYVQLQKDAQGQLEIIVLGEKVQLDSNNVALLSGRWAEALKPSDLPNGISFRLVGELSNGLGFFKEDHVTFSRGKNRTSLEFKVSSIYYYHEWDGMFSLDDTILKRKLVLQQSDQFTFIAHVKKEKCTHLRFYFELESTEDQSLVEILEMAMIRLSCLEGYGYTM
ncbi:hypothetical protein [Brevibacillus laterosporus]|uniref:hypothetical protein n=1 Tax=Brevibacillus laterosporus TaxID=1465 RepID=UPI000CE57994|nr:hypothetical protein [Brevibacillus laterosporus]AYB37820.1 hypothetical protein D5F52_05720 [Brevibacillus laterosporus]MBM7110122.1 hypothetical protein [Brevibacillus laterosporus]MCR8935945.1 hypothetical protein [Brevibacillus laterosporus]MCZ0838584.1 hypothetical protein [Brevibacillus laterosporus]MCZ0843257.1 hypothetical protein [Brevibacillus laterosporus]